MQLLECDVDAMAKVGSRSITSTEPSKSGFSTSHHATEAPMNAPPITTTSNCWSIPLFYHQAVRPIEGSAVGGERYRARQVAIEAITTLSYL